MVVDVCVYGVSEIVLPDRDDAIEALRFDRTHESLGECVKVRAARWELDRVQPKASKHVDHRLRGEWIAIVDQVFVVAQEPVEGVELPTQHIAHPPAVRLIADPHNLDTTSRQIDHKEHVESGQALPGPYFDGEEVHRGDTPNASCGTRTR